MEFRDPLLPLWAMELFASLFLWVWLFCIGATVGSFLNVVVYRLPRGENLAYPGSYCPRCGHHIRLRDNIPILSWLNLRGRCRDCKGRISPRYFWVELAVAIAFVTVLAADIFLPAGSLGFATRFPLTPREVPGFWCMYGLHVVLVTTIIGVILIRADGSPVPARIFLPALLLGLGMPLAFPEIRSVPAMAYGDLSAWQIGLIDGVLGLGMGAAVGLLASVPARQKGWTLPVVIAAGCSIGVVLGWQRTPVWLIVVLPLCDLVTTIVRLFASQRSAEPSALAEPTPDELSPTSPPQPLDSP